MENYRVETEAEEEFIDGSGYHFIESADQDYKSLTEEDKEILDQVILICGKDTKRQIVNRMHMETAYKETKPGDVISFEYARELSMN